MKNLEIKKVQNGFIVYEVGYTSMPKIWVAASPKELVILIEDLVEKGSSDE